MSYDLGFFTYRDGQTLHDVRTAYHEACAGDLTNEGVTDATLESFVAALERQYPQLSALQDDQLDDSPWSCDFDLGTHHLVISMTFSKAAEVGAFIHRLLRDHSLVVYDPQSDSAFVENQPLV
ncbi:MULTISPECIES: hypothetical protein [Burkholderia]|uniref:hypothetical protein n=1 Tax=Burkholderia TaxID=32008 RepID=UPI000690D73B|nr:MULTISPECIES: hypothetical protein [Burkholderia]